MLAQLSISNFAIIKHLEMTLRPGLNILSGETGAGKSIIINAMNHRRGPFQLSGESGFERDVNRVRICL
jgi:DNA repair ATPase RecN